jgi:hypothetical protein
MFGVMGLTKEDVRVQMGKSNELAFPATRGDDGMNHIMKGMKPCYVE